MNELNNTMAKYSGIFVIKKPEGIHQVTGAVIQERIAASLGLQPDHVTVHIFRLLWVDMPFKCKLLWLLFNVFPFTDEKEILVKFFIKSEYSASKPSYLYPNPKQLYIATADVYFLPHARPEKTFVATEDVVPPEAVEVMNKEMLH